MDVPKIYIADASVLIKWAVAEVENLTEANIFRNDFLNARIKIILPGHCLPEVANYFGRKAQHIAVSFLSFLITSDIEENCLTFPEISIAFKLMKKYPGISFYDASYHTLAMQENGVFITADEKYYRKTKKEGHIMLLKDYGKRR
ncbi:type II toxin-antitoxin system VapC family toxin [Candidatus Peregrinibacteria bacterium]|nr:type II toxin-antitoxin system VapC family toxin [Candidatus Peregrinibacteria bacterium]